MMSDLRAQAVAHSLSLRGPYTPPPAPVGTRGLAVEIGCPSCAGTITMLAPGIPDTHRTTAIVTCTNCRIHIQIVATLAVIHDPKYRAPNGCGQVRRKTRAAA